MNLHKIAMGALCLALFGLTAMPRSAQAQEQDSLTYESLSSALDDLESQTQTLGQLDAQKVHVVNVEDIFTDLDDTQRQRLRKMYRNVETEALHDAIENSSTMKAALKNETGTQVDAGDVVAIDMQDGGQILAYVDPNGTLKGRGTDDFQQREAQVRDRDTSETGKVQQHAQPRDRNTYETGNVQQQGAQQQDPQTFERLHSLMHDMKTHTQALMRTSAQRTGDEPTDERRRDAQSVRVVTIEDITAELDDTQIQRLRRTYQDAETDELHSAIENNEGVMNSLETNTNTEFDISDVVAVDVRDTGETVIFVDPNGELEGGGTGDYE